MNFFRMLLYSADSKC